METNVFPSDTIFFLMLPYLTGWDEDLLCIRSSSNLKQNSLKVNVLHVAVGGALSVLRVVFCLHCRWWWIWYLRAPVVAGLGERRLFKALSLSP